MKTTAGHGSNARQALHAGPVSMGLPRQLLVHHLGDGESLPIEIQVKDILRTSSATYDHDNQAGGLR